MSDPIRSISQNNFLLAAQQEVSHDNTLSGNGTEASPLGLNETVLWEGDANNGTLNLSEAVTNFEYIRIDFSTSINSVSTIWSYNSVAKLYPTDKLMVNKVLTINEMIPDGSSINTLVIRISNWNINADGNQFIFRDGYQVYFNGSSWSTGNSNTNIYKIVGINRKPSA